MEKKSNFNLSGGVDVVVTDVGNNCGEVKICTLEKVYILNYNFGAGDGLLSCIKSCSNEVMLGDLLQVRNHTVDVLSSYEKVCFYVQSKLGLFSGLSKDFTLHVGLVLAGFYDECKFYESRLNKDEVFAGYQFCEMLRESFSDLNFSLVGERSDIYTLRSLFFRNWSEWLDYVLYVPTKESVYLNGVLTELKSKIL